MLPSNKLHQFATNHTTRYYSRMPQTRGHMKRARNEPAESPHRQRTQKVCADSSTPSTETAGDRVAKAVAAPKAAVKAKAKARAKAEAEAEAEAAVAVKAAAAPKAEAKAKAKAMAEVAAAVKAQAEDEAEAEAAAAVKAKVEAEVAAAAQAQLCNASSSATPAATGGIKAMIAQLQASVSALKTVNPQLLDKDDLDAVYKAVVELDKVSDEVQAQQEAVRNPPPEETPLIFDDLVHTLGFLTSEDLGSAAQVSRHFSRAVLPAVRYRLDCFGGITSSFELGYKHTLGVPLLARVEYEFKRLPTVLAQIKSGEAGTEVTEALDELTDMDPNVLYLHADQLWEKLAELKDEVDNHSRGELLSCLCEANIPEDQLADRVGDLIYELTRGDECPTRAYTGLLALRLTKRMPVSVLEKHVDTLVSWLMHDSGFIACQALEALERMGIEKLASLQLKAKIASAPVATSSKRQDRSARDQFLSLLAQLPE